MPLATPQRLPATAPPRERFTLSYAHATLHVESEVEGVRELTERLLAPAFRTTEDGRPGDHPRLEVVLSTPADVPADARRAMERMPTLLLDGTRQVVLDRDTERVTVLQLAEADATELLLTSWPARNRLRLAVPDGSFGALRGVSRVVKFLVGAQLTAAGAPVFHGSAVARDGEGVLIVGPSGGGKTSLMFLVATLAGWDFVSDDLVFTWPDPTGTGLRMSGWPNRVGLSVPALSGHPARARFEQASLRRYEQPLGPLDTGDDRPWSIASRVRIYCDIDEFLHVAQLRGAADVPLSGVVVPVAERDRRGWSISVSGERGWCEEFGANIRQRKHVTDFLGVLPHRGDSGSVAAQAAGRLARLPVVRVHYGQDMLRDVPGFWAEVTAALAAVRS